MGAVTGQRQVLVGDPPEQEVGQTASEDGARCDAAAVIAAERHDVAGEPMEAGQAVLGHADLAVPFVLESDAGELGKQAGEGAPAPILVNGAARTAKRADAAEDQPPGRVEAEGTQDLPRVPHALAAGQDGAPKIVAERRGREIEIGQVDEFGAEFGPERLGIGVGGHDDGRRPDAAARGADPPGAALVLGRRHGAAREDLGPGRDGDAGEPARIGERLDGPGPMVEERTGIGRRPDEAGRLGGVEQFDGRAVGLPLPRPFGDLGQALRPDGAMQRAAALDLAGDAVAGHEVEHDGGRVAEQVEQPRPVRGAERVRHGVGHDPHPGIHETGVATRAAEADLDAFEHRHPGAALGEVQGRRQAREAAADDHDIGRDIGREHRRVRGRRSRALPEPWLRGSSFKIVPCLRAGARHDFGDRGPGRWRMLLTARCRRPCRAEV